MEKLSDDKIVGFGFGAWAGQAEDTSRDLIQNAQFRSFAILWGNTTFFLLYINAIQCLSLRFGKGEMSVQEEACNNFISAIRVTVERAFSRMKAYSCLSTPWRSRLWKHKTIFVLLAQLMNLQLDIHPLVKTAHPFLTPATADEMQKMIDRRFGYLIERQ
jgi:hypothetical protein